VHYIDEDWPTVICFKAFSDHFICTSHCFCRNSPVDQHMVVVLGVIIDFWRTAQDLSSMSRSADLFSFGLCNFSDFVSQFETC
jgi:hypothetical protein